MNTRVERLITALTVIELYGSQKKIARGLRLGLEPIRNHWRGLDAAKQTALEAEAEDLEGRGVDVVMVSDETYPRRLRGLEQAPPMMFLMGNQDLLVAAGVGMCGSRNVSEDGLRAARTCGRKVAGNGLTVISGYAKGVDTETHLAALDAGGKTVIVLAEGIMHFKAKKVFERVGLSPAQTLVVSQFPPRQRWNVGAAMARNTIIAGLGIALVVIEAGETGGTINAGKQALAMNRPVVALEFSEGTPQGNRILHHHGAHSISTPGHLGTWLETLAVDQEVPIKSQSQQLAFRVPVSRAAG